MQKMTLIKLSGLAVAVAVQGAVAAEAMKAEETAVAAEAAKVEAVQVVEKAAEKVVVTPEAVKAAVAKGVAWLKNNQREDGAWSNANYPGLTALGLWALAKTGDADAAESCSKAAKYIAALSQPDGGIYKPAGSGRGSGGLATYNTAICMTALHAYNEKFYAPTVLKARTFVAESQLVGDSPSAGGYGYEGINVEQKGPRSRADMSNTSWALTAMRMTQNLEDMRPAGEKRADVDWTKALAFVEKMQNRDEADEANYGGFGYEAGGSRGGAAEGSANPVALRCFGSMTYAGLESMIYAQVGKDDPRVRSAIAWAAKHWSVDENPGMGSKGLYYYYTIIAKALTLTGSDKLEPVTGNAITWKNDLAAKLLATQRDDGSWANSDNSFWEADPALVTSYALLIFSYLR